MSASPRSPASAGCGNGNGSPAAANGRRRPRPRSATELPHAERLPAGTGDDACGADASRGGAEACAEGAAATPPRAPRSVEEGARHVLAAWRAGRSDTEILESLDEAGLSPRAAKSALRRAAARLRETAALVDAPARLARAVEQREGILARALEKADLRVALSALDSREKLLGLPAEAGSEGPATLLALIDRAMSGPNRTDVTDASAGPETT